MQKPLNTEQKIAFKKPMLISHLLLGLMLAAWFWPRLQPLLEDLDRQIFILLNSSLLLNQQWLSFWGYLNHPSETWLNLLIMIGINFIICFALKGQKRREALVNVFYYWFMFQLILPINHVIFSDTLDIHRLSPSLTLTPPVWLSEAMGIPGIKDASQSSFPAGHTLVAMYWLLFSLKTAPKRFYPLLILAAGLLCTNRLFSGAHWASDVIFTLVLGWAWYQWATFFPAYAWFKRRTQKSNMIN